MIMSMLILSCRGVEHEVVQLRSALRKSQPNHAEFKEKVSISFFLSLTLLYWIETSILIVYIILEWFNIHFNPFPASHNFLLSALSSTSALKGSLYCKQYAPRSDCSFKSSLIRVHFVFCFDEKV